MTDVAGADKIVSERFKTEAVKLPSTNNLVYEYGVRLTPESISHLMNEYRKANECYNACIAVARKRVEEAITFLKGKIGAPITTLESEIAVLVEKRKLARSVDDRKGYEECTKALRSARKTYYELLHKARKEHLKELRAITDHFAANKSGFEMYEVRGKFVNDGLAWGTAGAVLDAAFQAVKKTWAKFEAPRFSAFSEKLSNKVELQFTGGGRKVSDIFDTTNADFHITEVNTSNGHKKYLGFKYRIGTKAKGFFTCEGTVNYHREIAQDAIIRRARLVQKRIGLKSKYFLQIMVELPDGAKLDVPAKRSTMVGLDLGWYYEDAGRRVIALADNKDPEAASLIRLPADVDSLFDKAEEFASVRSTARDNIVEELKAIQFRMAPEELAEKLNNIRRIKTSWVASSKLAHVTRYWRDNHPTYFQEFLVKLVEWMKADKLNNQREAFSRRKAMMKRRDFYRNIAVALVKKYSTIVIDNTNLEETARVKNETTGKHNNLGATARNGRVRAGLSYLEESIRWAAARSNTGVVMMRGPTTKTCPVCNSLMTKETEGSRTCSCPACGIEVDRDKSAAVVTWKKSYIQKDHIREQIDVANSATNAAVQRRAEIKEKRRQSRIKNREPEAAANPE